MTISTIRSYTEEDKARVRAAAERFCERHGIKVNRDDSATAAEFAAWASENIMPTTEEQDR